MSKINNLKYTDNNKLEILNIKYVMQMLNEIVLENVITNHIINFIVKGGAKYGLHS